MLRVSGLSGVTPVGMKVLSACLCACNRSLLGNRKNRTSQKVLSTMCIVHSCFLKFQFCVVCSESKGSSQAVRLFVLGTSREEARFLHMFS